MDFWREILMYALPSGFLGMFCSWILNRKVQKAKAIHEELNVYRSMYLEIKTTMEEIADENRKLYYMVSRLERAISRVTRCSYAENCPVTDELCNEGASRFGETSGDGCKDDGKNKRTDFGGTAKQ